MYLPYKLIIEQEQALGLDKQKVKEVNKYERYNTAAKPIKASQSAGGEAKQG